MGQITLSIGVATFPDHGEDKDSLLRAADRALYKAKDAGRNQVMVAVPEKLALMEAATARLEMAATDGERGDGCRMSNCNDGWIRAANRLRNRTW